MENVICIFYTEQVNTLFNISVTIFWLQQKTNEFDMFFPDGKIWN